MSSIFLVYIKYANVEGTKYVLQSEPVSKSLLLYTHVIPIRIFRIFWESAFKFQLRQNSELWECIHKELSDVRECNVYLHCRFSSVIINIAKPSAPLLLLRKTGKFGRYAQSPVWIQKAVLRPIMQEEKWKIPICCSINFRP